MTFNPVHSKSKKTEKINYSSEFELLGCMISELKIWPIWPKQEILLEKPLTQFSCTSRPLSLHKIKIKNPRADAELKRCMIFWTKMA